LLQRLHDQQARDGRGQGHNRLGIERKPLEAPAAAIGQHCDHSRHGGQGAIESLAQDQQDRGCHQQVERRHHSDRKHRITRNDGSHGEDRVDQRRLVVEEFTVQGIAGQPAFGDHGIGALVAFERHLMQGRAQPPRQPCGEQQRRNRPPGCETSTLLRSTG